MTERIHDGAVPVRSHTFAVLAYKQSPYLEECITSLKAQTVASRIIIATSTPSTFITALSERYGIPVVANERSEGIAADWSFAYNSCESDYVTLAHQDDVYASGYTEECLAAARRNPDNLIVFTDSSELVDGRTRRHSSNLLVKKAISGFFYLGRERLDGPFFKKRLLSFGNPISCPTVMFHRQRIGQFEFARDLSYNLDWEAWIRLSQQEGGFVYVKKNLVSHRIHRDSTLVKGTADGNRKNEDALMFQRFWPSPIAIPLSFLYIRLIYRSQER